MQLKTIKGAYTEYRRCGIIIFFAPPLRGKHPGMRIRLSNSSDLHAIAKADEIFLEIQRDSYIAYIRHVKIPRERRGFQKATHVTF